MADAYDRPRVLVIGPMGGGGGMAAVARQTGDAAHLPDWDIRVVDTGRTTGADRSRTRALLAHLGRFARLVGALVRHRPHIAHIHTCSFMTFLRTMPEILACRLLRSQIVLHIHGGFFDSFLEALGPLSYRLVSAHLRMCRRVILLGERWRSRLTAIVPGLAVEVVPNAIDTTLFATANAKRRGRQILFVGDLARTKGVEDLIEAVSKLSHELRQRVCVRIVGGGAAGRREQLGQFALAKGVSQCIEFLGPLRPGDVRKEYARADVFALPSYGEGMPISLLEAMASALPSVVSDVGAVREVVRDGVEAFIVSPGDTLALADRFLKLLADGGRRRSMGAAAADRVRREFDATRFYTHLAAIWRDLAQARVFAAPFKTCS